jgi:hypothetical protein
VTTLHRGLRSSLRQSLEESNDSLFSLSYDNYIELVQLRDRRSRPQHQKPKHDPNILGPEPMQLNALNITTPRSRSSSQSSYDRHDHRSENGLCYYCGSDEHWIPDCPGRPSPSTRPPRTKTTAKSANHPSLRRALPPP